MFFDPLSTRYNGNFLGLRGVSIAGFWPDGRGFDCRVSDGRPTCASLLKEAGSKHSERPLEEAPKPSTRHF